MTHEDDFIVSMYFRDRTSIRCVCTANTGKGWQSVHLTGDFRQTDALGFKFRNQLVPVLAADPNPCQFVAGLCGIEVLTEDEPMLVGMFGDSITHMSFVFDPLMDLLYARFPGKLSMVNGGIAGNRVQKDAPVMAGFPGEGKQFGQAGVTRFQRDLCPCAPPDLVILMEGVNDCSHSILFGEPVPTAWDIFNALENVTAQAYSLGSKVCIATVPPFGAFGESWREQAEGLRCALNELIRNESSADKQIDLDAVMRDPVDEHRMQEGMHLGDGVHPNWAGGRKMAGAIFDGLFLQ